MTVLPRFRAIIASIFVGVTLHLSHAAAYASVSSMDRVERYMISIHLRSGCTLPTDLFKGIAETGL